MKKQNEISQIQIEIVSLFTRGFDKELYVREIAKKLNISPRTSQLNLQTLENKTVLKSQVRGKIKLYSLQRTPAAKDFLLLAEINKKIKFLNKHPSIKEFAEKITPHIGGSAAIFGSYAKERATKQSDLDILIIGKYDDEKIREIKKTYQLEANIINYPEKAFKKSDTLINEVLDAHIIILNAEKFINLIWKE